jgi:phospholipid/cholesterol/gamma-HCH transport system ATP-binding protein
LSESCIIELKDVSAGFDATVILHDISLCARPSEILSLIGGSGSGKTTLLRLMLGLEKPLHGQISVFGRRLDRAGTTELSELRDRCGVVFQAGALFSALSVYDNVALPLRELKTLPESVIQRVVLRKLALVEIDRASFDKVPAQLSGGMVKRVALARALALDPQLLYLDEPTAGLDPQRALDFVLLIDSLRREMALTVVMATHDVDTVVALADRVAAIADQRLVAVAPLPEIVNHPHRFVRSYFMGQESRCEQHALRAFRGRLNKVRRRAAGE